MALETVVYQQDMFAYCNKDLYNVYCGGNIWGCDFDLAASELETSIQKVPDDQYPQIDSASNISSSTTRSSRRRQSRPKKNQEEIEKQRMAHIAVERNRRKQTNEYLSLLLRLMPEEYVQKGDQASIVGGAINYVKELEQQLQFLDCQNHMNHNSDAGSSSSSSSPFSEFFTFPQYSTTMNSSGNAFSITDFVNDSSTHRNLLAAAEIEVTMVDNHANLKIRSKKLPKQLMKIVSGLQSLRLTVLHLNVTTADQIVLYCITLKVEDDCTPGSVDEIAAAVNKILRRIQEEAAALTGCL